MTGNRLYKAEKLCGTTTVDSLFKEGNTIFVYPLRVTYRISDTALSAPARFLITVPKKKIRHAVDRVKMRRRIRGAYRLNRSHLVPVLKEAGKSIDIAFIYLSSDLKEYNSLQEKMISALQKIALSVNTTPKTEE